jgi:hypothetical protein
MQSLWAFQPLDFQHWHLQFVLKTSLTTISSLILVLDSWLVWLLQLFEAISIILFKHFPQNIILVACNLQPLYFFSQASYFNWNYFHLLHLNDELLL